MQVEVRVVLSQAIEYAKDGQMRRASFVTLRAPKSAAYRIAIQIKQEILRAIRDEIERSPQTEEQIVEVKLAELPSDQKPPKPPAPTGRQYLDMLGTSSANLVLIFDLVRQLILLHGIALLDGEVPMGPLEIESVDMDDLESIVGEYLVGFHRA